MLLDDGGELRERAVHHRAGRLGVEVLAQRGGAHDVNEQDGDLLEGLRRGFVRGRCRQRDDFGAQGGECRIDDRIAEQGALRLKPGDGGFELLPFSGHRVRGYQSRTSHHQYGRRRVAASGALLVGRLGSVQRSPRMSAFFSTTGGNR